MSNFDKIITESQIRKHSKKIIKESDVKEEIKEEKSEETTEENVEESKVEESKLIESEQSELPKINDLGVQFFNEVIKDDRGDAHAYEFIANHYWEMDKDTLKTILLEYIYRAEGEQDRYDMLQELYERLYVKDIIEEECPECLDAYLNIYKEYVDID